MKIKKNSKMKKLSLMGMATVAAGLVLLTSCLKGDNKYAGSDYGVVSSSSSLFTSVVYPAYSRGVPYPAPLYIKTIADDPSIPENACIQFTYQVDMENGANSNATVSANGFYTGTTTGYRIVESKPLGYTTTDTTRAMPNELTFTEVQGLGLVFYKKMLVVGTKPSKLLTDQKNNYDLYFNPSQTPSVESPNGGGSVRVYTMFLRAAKVQDGKAPVLDAEDRAFDISYFYDNIKNVESAKDEKSINFKIMYPTELSTDSLTVKKWNSTAVMTVQIVKEEK